MEQFDMSRLQRRKPDMNVSSATTTVAAQSYRVRAETLALSMLHERGIHSLCVDTIHNVMVDETNWVKCAHNMFHDTIAWEGKY